MQKLELIEIMEEQQTKHINENEMRPLTYNEDERQYLQMMQSNIERMASNSANCKNWMVMIVSAIFAVSCGINDMNWWLLLALFPICLFWYLDAFYLRLERGMRNRQRLYINICAGVEQTLAFTSALFDFSPLLFDRVLTEEETEKGYKSTQGCYNTESVKPFYLTALIVVLIIVFALNASDIIKLITSFFQSKVS